MPKLSSFGRRKKFRPKKSLTSLLHAALQLLYTQDLFLVVFEHPQFRALGSLINVHFSSWAPLSSAEAPREFSEGSLLSKMSAGTNNARSSPTQTTLSSPAPALTLLSGSTLTLHWTSEEERAWAPSLNRAQDSFWYVAHLNSVQNAQKKMAHF